MDSPGGPLIIMTVPKELLLPKKKMLFEDQQSEADRILQFAMNSLLGAPSLGSPNMRTGWSNRFVRLSLSLSSKIIRY